MKNTLPQWNLADLYPSYKSKAVDSDLKKSDALAAGFENKYKGKVSGLIGDSLAEAISQYEKIEELLIKLNSFAYLVYAENMEDDERSRFYQNVSEKVNDISAKLIFFGLEINNINEKELKQKLKSKKLSHYLPWIKDNREFKKYQLTDELEKLLHEKTVTSSQAWTRVFDETLASLRFQLGKKQLSADEIFNLLSSHDGKERKKAAGIIGGVLEKNIKTFTTITNVLAKDKAIEDKWRGFAKPISSRNLDNLVEDEVVEALISSVKKSYPNLSHRYYKIKAKWLGKKQLNYWDRNAPLPEDKSKKLSWNEARDIVLSAYGSFSPKMAILAKQFFDKNWIDAKPRSGKDSGAFSHPTTVSAHPYILMNYFGKNRDVMTLAHELGHGVHQLLSRKQGELMADTPLTLAETASVFGEQLTFQEILRREKNPRTRKIIIAGKVEDMLNTVVRQIAFCEFERQVHDARKNGELPTEKICDIWMKVQKESLGSGVKLSGDYKYYWSYIPHFIHTPFYVYAYAFGDCLVNALYAAYKSGLPNFEQKYFEMLEAGGTKRHRELLAPFGLDASNPKFWHKGLDIISDMIDELEK